MEILILSGIALAAAALTIYASSQSPTAAYLCLDCKFNQADLCSNIQRPQALVCYAYRPQNL